MAGAVVSVVVVVVVAAGGGGGELGRRMNRLRPLAAVTTMPSLYWIDDDSMTTKSELLQVVGSVGTGTSSPSSAQHKRQGRMKVPLP